MIRNYQVSKIAGLCIGIIMIICVFIIFPIWLSFDKNIRARGGVSIGVMSAFFIMAAVCFGGFLGRIYRMRPILIDESGITSFWRGRPWRFIEWSRVKRIEKSYIIVMFERPRDVISIYSTDKVIRFDDWIWNYEDLVEEVAVHARDLNIPTFEKKGKVSTPSKIF